MDLARILEQVPNADPAFVAFMRSLPEPEADVSSVVYAKLPDLHRLFIKKRGSLSSNEWRAMLAEEKQLISSV